MSPLFPPRSSEAFFQARSMSPWSAAAYVKRNVVTSQGADGYVHPAKWLLMKPAVVQGAKGIPETQFGSVDDWPKAIDMMK